MRRTLCLILLAALCLMSLTGWAEGDPEAPEVSAPEPLFPEGQQELETVTPDGFTFRTVNGRTAAELYRYDKNRTEAVVTVPASAVFSADGTVLTLPVVRLAAWAFEQASAVSEVRIPEGVTEIGDFCFSECTGLETVRLPSTLERLGTCAFMLCVSLEPAELPAALAEVGDNPFCYCTGLENIILLDDAGEETDTHKTLVWLRDEGVLMDRGGRLITRLCTAEGERVALPAGCLSVGAYALADNRGLREVTVPDSVVSLGAFAFYHCTSLRRAAVPASVTETGRDCFTLCHEDLVIATPAGSAVWDWAEACGIATEPAGDDAPADEEIPDEDGPFLEETDG